MAGTTRIFGGKAYKFHSYHYDKAFATEEVQKLRKNGKSARIVRAGEQKRGWNVYSR